MTTKDSDTILRVLAETNPDFDFTSGKDFLRNGGLDSFLIVVLVTELERTFSIDIPGELILPEYFESTNALMRLVTESRKTGP